jgi:hypothetical protein
MTDKTDEPNLVQMAKQIEFLARAYVHTLRASSDRIRKREISESSMECVDAALTNAVETMKAHHERMTDLLKTGMQIATEAVRSAQ